MYSETDPPAARFNLRTAFAAEPHGCDTPAGRGNLVDSLEQAILV